MNLELALKLALFSIGAYAGYCFGESEIEEVWVYEVYRATEETPVTFIDLKENYLDIQDYGQEPSFTLASTPSMTMYSDSGGPNGYTYIRLRGMDQTRINMTLNGAPLNEPEDQGVYFSNYPDFFSSLGNVQIQRGTGLSQNGAASYAGSMQFQSKEFTDSDYSQLEASYGSFNSYRVAAEHNSSGNQNYAWYIRGSAIGSDGYKYRSANKSNSVFAGSHIDTAAGIWTLTAFRGEQENELAWLGVGASELDADRRTNGNSIEDDSFKQSLVIANHENEIDNFRIFSGFYYNQLDGFYEFDVNNFIGEPSTGEVFNYGLSSEFKGVFSSVNYATPVLNMTAGFHGNDYSREHIGTSDNGARLYLNEGFKKSASVFIRSLYKMDQTSFFVDVQARRISFDYEGDNSFDRLSWSFINPNIGVAFEAKENTNLYYSVGRTGREPTRTDIFGGNDNLWLEEDGSPAIFIVDEETVVDHEAGIRYSGSSMMINANIYYMDFENEITLNGNFGPNGLALNENVDSSIRAGLELSANVKVATHWKVNTSLAWSNNSIEDEGISFEPVLSPELIIQQEVVYERGRWDIGVSGRYQSKSWLNFANTEKLDSHIVMSALAGYDWKKTSLRLHLINLTNKKYFSNGYVDFDSTAKYFVGMPFSVNLEMSVKF